MGVLINILHMDGLVVRGGVSWRGRVTFLFLIFNFPFLSALSDVPLCRPCLMAALPPTLSTTHCLYSFLATISVAYFYSHLCFPSPISAGCLLRLFVMSCRLLCLSPSLSFLFLCPLCHLFSSTFFFIPAFVVLVSVCPFFNLYISFCDIFLQ